MRSPRSPFHRYSKDKAMKNRKVKLMTTTAGQYAHVRRALYPVHNRPKTTAKTTDPVSPKSTLNKAAKANEAYARTKRSTARMNTVLR